MNGGVGVGAWELVLKGMKIVWRIGTMGVFVCWGCGRYGKWLEVDGGVGMGGGGCLGAVVWLSNFLFGVAYGVFHEQWAVWGGGRACRGPSVDSWFYCII